MQRVLLSLITLFILQNTFSQKLNDAAAHRIGDYGKLWVALTLFHPQMAYNTINADSLFTDNIGELTTNPSAANFRNAVQKMIDRLHDPYTTIKSRNKNTGDSISLPNRPLLQWLPDSIAILFFDNAFAYRNQNLNKERKNYMQ